MSASPQAGTPLEPAVDHDAGPEHADPPYMIIWVVLLVLTLAEVGYAFLELPKFYLALGLIVMAVWKALLVALYFMHLRWEPRRLWILATSPLPLIAILLLAVLQEF
jgi:cytochrome c oxidase subunit 4